MTKLRDILERHVRELPPGRRLRQELATASIERFADGRPLHVLDAGSGEGLLATALGRSHPDWQVDAVEAINEGHIFRFLNKPCAPELLARAVAAGAEQYRLLNAEKELLEQTLHGTITVQP